jgi:hypothetical protein
MNDYHRQILTDALEARIREVTEYEVNIVNFRLAIAKCGDDPDLQDFKVRMGDLLASSLIEQKKAQVMLDVIKEQLE